MRTVIMSLALPMLPMIGLCQLSWGPSLILKESHGSAHKVTQLLSVHQQRSTPGTLVLRTTTTPVLCWRQRTPELHVGAYYSLAASVSAAQGQPVPAVDVLMRPAGTTVWYPVPTTVQPQQQGHTLAASFEATATHMEVALRSKGTAYPTTYTVAQLQLRECLTPGALPNAQGQLQLPSASVPTLAAQVQPGHTHLQWHTTTPDSSVLYYRLERWAHGTGWKVLALLPARYLPTQYSYSDRHTGQPQQYRVAAIDWQDQLLYHTRPILAEAAPAAALAVYPNPATSQVTIQSDQPTAQILDANGLSVWQGQPGQAISLHQLPKGTYYIQAGQQRETLIVQK